MAKKSINIPFIGVLLKANPLGIESGSPALIGKI